MSNYEEGFKLLDEMFGNGKDNIITLATIAREPSNDGTPRPVVRGVNAYYENGVFYVTTHGRSNKMQQIAKNPEVSIASCSEMFTASGIGKNLGWVLDPKNADLRDKLRTAFAPWYDSANNEKDKNCCILAIHLTKGTLNNNHWDVDNFGYFTESKLHNLVEYWQKWIFNCYREKWCLEKSRKESCLF